MAAASTICVTRCSVDCRLLWGENAHGELLKQLNRYEKCYDCVTKHTASAESYRRRTRRRTGESVNMHTVEWRSKSDGEDREITLSSVARDNDAVVCCICCRPTTNTFCFVFVVDFIVVVTCFRGAPRCCTLQLMQRELLKPNLAAAALRRNNIITQYYRDRPRRPANVRN